MHISSQEALTILHRAENYNFGIVRHGYYSYDGLFADIDSSSELSSLQGFEQSVFDWGKKVVAKKGRFVSLDFGAGLAYSQMRIASRAVIEGLTVGREDDSAFHLLASNFEYNFSVLSVLMEAQERLDIFGSFDRQMEVISLLYEIGRSLGVNAVSAVDLILKTQQDMNFVTHNHHLVTYMNGINLETVKTALSEYEPEGKVDLVYENEAGMYHNRTQPRRIAEVINDVLHPNHGMLITTTRGDDDEVHLALLESGFVEMLRKPLKYQKAHTVYTRPESDIKFE